MKAIAILFLISGAALTATAQDQLGALAPANLNKSRPAAPFDITGTWQHGGGRDNPFQFAPPPGFKLTPASQVQYDAAQKARKEGKAYHDDIGQCWPAGLPVIMTRVWPIAMVQKPTAIYMISAFLTGMAGTFYTQYIYFIDPQTAFNFNISIEAALVSIVGGVGTLWGPVIGTIMLETTSALLQSWLGNTIGGVQLTVYALILMAVILWRPTGIMGYLTEVYGRRVRTSPAQT